MSESDFYARVYEVVKTIPVGSVSTYGLVGAAIGMKSSARMVGWALNACPPGVPAHRVVNRNGELTGKQHFATPTLMRELLEAENVSFVDERVDLEKHLYEPPIQRVKRAY